MSKLKNTYFNLDNFVLNKLVKEQEEGPSYDEVWLKDKLGDSTKDKYEFDDNRGHIDIYPDLGDMRAERSSQFIRFKLEKGEIHFVHAFGYERGYDMLKSTLPELAPMSDSSFAGFMNVNTDGGTIPVDIDTANKMIDALRRGLDAEAGAQTDFYSSRGPTSGTIDEIKIKGSSERMKQLLKEAAPLIGALARMGSMARGAAATARTAATRTANAAKSGVRKVQNFNKKYGDYIDAADAINDMRKDAQRQAKEDEEDEKRMDQASDY